VAGGCRRGVDVAAEVGVVAEAVRSQSRSSARKTWPTGLSPGGWESRNVSER
jgi:hypothetical protein